MSRAQSALRSLLLGVFFAGFLGVVYYFSSGLHPVRVLLAGTIFAALTYVSSRRREKRRDR